MEDRIKELERIIDLMLVSRGMSLLDIIYQERNLDSFDYEKLSAPTYRASRELDRISEAIITKELK